jgi:hypothetical protein
MSNWSLVSLIAGLIGCTSAQPGSFDARELRLGHAEQLVIGGQSLGYFDGERSLHLQNGNVIDPKVPATVFAHRDSGRLVLNYGAGSGQVLGYEIYDLTGKRTNSDEAFRKFVLGEVKDTGCLAPADQFSVIVQSVTLTGRAVIRTEDFTRREGCHALNAKWQFPLWVDNAH